MLGVLVVQNRTARHYDEEEVETLQTIAMVLAEMVAAGEIVSPNEVQQVDGLGLLPLRLDGVQLNAGLAMGRAVLHEPRIVIRTVVAEDVAAEQIALREAARRDARRVDRMLEADDMQSGEHREILETYRMFADDRGWLQRMREAVALGPHRRGRGAEGARRHARAARQASDPYLRERLHDLEDLANRLLRHLAGARRPSTPASCPTNASWSRATWGRPSCSITTARGCEAWCSRRARPLSHVAIVARALDIPVVGRAPTCSTRVEPGDPMVVDGEKAPGPAAAGRGHRAGGRRRDRGARRAPAQVCRAARPAGGDARRRAIAPEHECRPADRPAVSRRDRRRRHRPLPHRAPVHGAPEFPDVDAQAELYSRVLDQAGDRPVTFRTLDVGGDKVLPYVGAVRRGESGDGLARDPHRRSTARRCCASSCAR